MKGNLCPLSCLLTLAVLVLCSTDAAARASHKADHDKKSHESRIRQGGVREAEGAPHRKSAASKRIRHAKHARAEQRKTARPAGVAAGRGHPTATRGLAAVRNAIDLTRKAQDIEATALEKTSNFFFFFFFFFPGYVYVLYFVQLRTPSSPSISARSWATTRFSTSPCTFSRFGAMASSSSRKTMHRRLLAAPARRCSAQLGPRSRRRTCG